MARYLLAHRSIYWRTSIRKPRWTPQKKAVTTLINGLAEIESRHLDDKDADDVMKQKIALALMDVNKCPDFVMDKGHYFPWFDSMTDDDKNALIELRKTL